jgi:hypothetical protein
MAAKQEKKQQRKPDVERKEKLDRLVDDVRRDVTKDADTFLKESEVREGGE